MCLIVDANCAHLFFKSSQYPDAKPAFDWISDRRCNGRLVYGGKLENELKKDQGAARSLLDLWRDGRAIRVEKNKVDSETERVRKLGLCRSNDHHVIALAIVSGARVLYSHDGKPQADFDNPKLINHPRGRVYKYAKHKRLLVHTRSCGFSF
jgi:hypothetical protein